jgi:hypothetical protein
MVCMTDETTDVNGKPTETQANRPVKKEIGETERAAGRLLTALADLQDSLALKAEGCEGAEEVSGFVSDAALLLCEAVDKKPKFGEAKPRRDSEKDRQRLLPGQHRGVHLEFGTDDGIVFVNFYGGLRTAASGDWHDGDVSLTNSHANRTDAVLAQRTFLNVQLSAGGRKVDSWIAFDMGGGGSFKQETLIVDDTFVDCHPAINSSDPNFEKMKRAIFDPIASLIKLVPNEV